MINWNCCGGHIDSELRVTFIVIAQYCKNYSKMKFSCVISTSIHTQTYLHKSLNTYIKLS